MNGGSNVPTLNDRWDFGWVRSYAAVGDSYAAGIGVGDLSSEDDAK